MTIVIRDEQPSDIDAIFELTRLAFLNAPHTSHTEQFIVNELRRSGQLALSLVADEDPLIGHVAFSPLSMSNGEVGWYGVGPLSVLPKYQKKGIGTQLMQNGMERLISMGARGCILVGDPNYYARLGFAVCEGLVFPGVPHEYILFKPFCHAMPKGEFSFSPAFWVKA